MSTTNPLVPYLIKAQETVVQARAPGTDKAAAIESLADLLCTPEVNLALLEAGFLRPAVGHGAAQLAAA